MLKKLSDGIGGGTSKFIVNKEYLYCRIGKSNKSECRFLLKNNVAHSIRSKLQLAWLRNIFRTERRRSGAQLSERLAFLITIGAQPKTPCDPSNSSSIIVSRGLRGAPIMARDASLSDSRTMLHQCMKTNIQGVYARGW